MKQIGTEIVTNITETISRVKDVKSVSAGKINKALQGIKSRLLSET